MRTDVVYRRVSVGSRLVILKVAINGSDFSGICKVRGND